MKTQTERIPDALFSQFTEHMPECCVEVVVHVDDGVLLVRRTNEPAKGEWFWPGSRLYKGEAFEAAAHSVANEELGIQVKLRDQLGTSAVAGNPSRHTVNVVYAVEPTKPNPTITPDDQHDDYRILTEPDSDLHDYFRRYVCEHDLLA